MEESPDTIIEVREELMVSPSTGGHPTLRTAYFLKPSMRCIKESSPNCDFLHPHSLFSKTFTSSSPSNLPPEVRYNGWLRPHKEWKRWVKKMQRKYEHVWIKAGIDQAIKASTYLIHRNDELILELSQRWCSKTNTFIFPWGEATITLEDMKLCGGYSILGDIFSVPLETKEQMEAEEELIEVRRMLVRSKAKRAGHTPWMVHFMRNESQVEHEGFLSLWISRFVFPANALHTILKCVFPIAIHLARGTRIALAPPVLASIYRDLSLLNSSINDAVDATNLGPVIWAPFQLVQIWALERFPALHPQPHAIEQYHPRIARWHKVKLLKNINLRLTLDSAGARNCFLWRPYENSPSLQLHNEKDMWECDNPSMDNELRSFGRCLRVSELVGMGCIEQYLPHRVAMQFGMDQDIPGIVNAHCNKDPWISYSQPIVDTNLCNALCACQPNVTSRYYNWWNQSRLGKQGDTRKGDDHCDISICSSEQEDKLPIIELLSSSKVECSEDEVVGCGKALSSPQSGAIPSSSVGDEIAGSVTGGVCSFAQGKGVLRGSKCTKEDGQTKDIFGGAIRAKGDSVAKMKGQFCDTNGVSDMEGEGTVPCIVDIASYLENRIWKLERVFAKLKAAKFGPKFENIGAKAKP